MTAFLYAKFGMKPANLPLRFVCDLLSSADKILAPKFFKT
jgi:hypothetical protein